MIVKDFLPNKISLHFPGNSFHKYNSEYTWVNFGTYELRIYCHTNDNRDKIIGIEVIYESHLRKDIIIFKGKKEDVLKGSIEGFEREVGKLEDFVDKWQKRNLILLEINGYN